MSFACPRRVGEHSIPEPDLRSSQPENRKKQASKQTNKRSTRANTQLDLLTYTKLVLHLK